MAKRRRFTPEFKVEVVLEALRDESLQAELRRQHNLSDEQLSKWKQQVVENVASESIPDPTAEARRGHPWKNGYTERLIQTLKEEEVHLNNYEDITEARDRNGSTYHKKSSIKFAENLSPQQTFGYCC